MKEPDVLKRLEEIELALPFGVEPEAEPDIRWLLRLIRALLESQGELMDWIRPNELCERQECVRCQMLTRAEAVRRGEG